MPLTTVSPGVMDTQATATWRNRIINGDMRIDQRNAGAEINPAISGVYYVDRWFANSSAASKFRIGQNAGSVTPPTGFRNYLGLTSLSAYGVGAGEYFGVTQIIEGFNVADLAWGTANAATVTLSFWVRSSLTGTFGGSLSNSGYSRSYPFTYAISTANTWEQKTITIPGDTTGTWLTTNGAGLILGMSIGSGATLSGPSGVWAAATYTSATGATSVVGTNGATFYITGVQLEAGSVATPFERRDYGRELVMCQRYYEVYLLNNVSLIGTATSASLGAAILNWCVTKRAAPTITLPTAGQTTGTVTFLTNNGGYPATTGSNAAVDITTTKASISGTGYSGLSSTGVSIFWSTSTSTIGISSEL